MSVWRLCVCQTVFVSDIAAGSRTVERQKHLSSLTLLQHPGIWHPHDRLSLDCSIASMAKQAIIAACSAIELKFLHPAHGRPLLKIHRPLLPSPPAPHLSGIYCCYVSSSFAITLALHIAEYGARGFIPPASHGPARRNAAC